MDEAAVEILGLVGNQLRILSIVSTTAAGSGHPTSCCSAADLVAGLFFGQMRFDPLNPRAANNDRFILSKGHAAPLLYAAWAETGFLAPEDLIKLRKLNSDLEGHPTPRLPFVDVATGSLGQGLSAGAGMAMCARLDRLDYRTYVLLGDGECAEGSVWEAATFAGVNHLNNLIAIVDVNRLAQSQATALGHNLEAYSQRFEACGWRTEIIDGHDMEEILEVYSAAGLGNQPLAIIAKTFKGHGISFVADKDGWHGKVLNREEAERATAELQTKAQSARGLPIPKPSDLPLPKNEAPTSYPPFAYKLGDKVATREAFGNALVRMGEVDERLIALDGDVKNSTYEEKFFNKFPERSVECFIAEQNMVGVANGFSARGKVPFVATFAAFLTRAHDQIRMAQYSMANLKLVGSHVGVSIGEDGPSQMGLEDLAMMRAIAGSVVLYPSDAVATEKLTEQMALTHGIAYLRTSRPKTPVIYQNDEVFPIGGAKILRQSDADKVTVVAAGATLFEALQAADALAEQGTPITVIDAYSVKPLAKHIIQSAAEKTGRTIITVEDHYPEGGLGDAVAGELSAEGFQIHKLAVYEAPRSGTPEELLAKYHINAEAIIAKVKSLLKR